MGFLVFVWCIFHVVMNVFVFFVFTHFDSHAACFPFPLFDSVRLIHCQPPVFRLLSPFNRPHLPPFSIKSIQTPPPSLWFNLHPDLNPLSTCQPPPPSFTVSPFFMAVKRRWTMPPPMENYDGTTTTTKRPAATEFVKAIVMTAINYIH